MTDSTFLQIFLLVNVFIIGVLAPFAFRHARAHFRPPPTVVEKPHPGTPVVHLPPAIKEQLLETARTNFQTILNHSATELQEDLKSTATQLNGQLQKLGAEVAKSETDRYHTMLEELRKQTEAAFGSAQTEMSEHKAELVAKLNEEMAAEKQRLLNQIDTKLADAVASFLIETMQHNVDLGAQQAYLTTVLEAHKSELSKGIKDEA